MLARGQIFGNIYVTEKQGADEFTADDERALQVLATQAGVAVENARLYEEMVRAQDEVRRLEVLDERGRPKNPRRCDPVALLGQDEPARRCGTPQDEGVSVRIKRRSRTSTVPSAICATTSSGYGQASSPIGSSIKRCVSSARSSSSAPEWSRS